MNMEKETPKDVDSYIAAAPKEAQGMLKELRQTIKGATPQAEEVISYGIIGYKYHGPLVYFGPAKKHIGFYGAGSAIFKKYKDELKDYKQSKGTIRFPIDQPLPLALIKRMVKERLAENETRKSGYGRKGG